MLQLDATTRINYVLKLRPVNVFRYTGFKGAECLLLNSGPQASKVEKSGLWGTINSLQSENQCIYPGSMLLLQRRKIHGKNFWGTRNVTSEQEINLVQIPHRFNATFKFPPPRARCTVKCLGKDVEVSN